MVTRNFKKTNEDLPMLGFGGMRLPQNPDNTIDRETAGKMFDFAYASGVRYFDTAYGYHNGESAKFFGDFLCEARADKFPRESLRIANKMPLWAIKEPGDVDKVFRYQLDCVKTSYFDFYLLHAMNGDLWQKAKDTGAYEYCLERKKEGIIKNFGFSFHGSIDALEKMLDEGSWDFVQIQFNYLDYYTGNAKAEYEAIARHGLPIVVMEPVRGGALANLSENALAALKAVTDSSPAQFAFRFCASFENVMVILSGMSTEAQTEDNIKTFEDIKPLSDDEMKGALHVVAAIKDGKFIPCTNCRYCIEDCPMEVKIPDTFAIYNKYLAAVSKKKPEDPEIPLPEAIKDEASKCVGCGACAERCPQKIRIPDIFSSIQGQ